MFMLSYEGQRTAMGTNLRYYVFETGPFTSQKPSRQTRYPEPGFYLSLPFQHQDYNVRILESFNVGSEDKTMFAR